MRYAGLAFLCVIVCFAQGCKQNEATGRTQFNFMSMDQQIALGAEAAPELVEQYGGEVQSKELKDFVAGVGRRLSRKVEGSYRELEWRFYVLDSDIINAFALPGGRVFISRGLMSHMENEAELAAVLGHEIGHVTAEHGGERMSQSLGIGAITAGAGYALGDTPMADLTNMVVGVAGQGFLLTYGRSQESEADRLGMRYMVAGGYDPTGMLQLLQILIDASGGNRQPEILSTHPDPERRLSDATTLLESDYSRTQGNKKYRLFGERWRKKASPHLPPPGQASFRDSGGSGGSGGSEFIQAASWCSHCADTVRLGALSQHD